MAFEIDDIGELAAAETDTFQLKDARDEPIFRKSETGERVPVTVTVFGPGSEEHARAVTARSNKQLKRLRKKGDVVMTASDVAEDGADFLAAITKDFGNLKHKGQLVVTRDQVRAVYLDRRIGFIADQVNERVSSWENFTTDSATS